MHASVPPAASGACGGGVEQSRAARVARSVQQPGEPRPQPVAAQSAALRSVGEEASALLCVRSRGRDAPQRRAPGAPRAPPSAPRTPPRPQRTRRALRSFHTGGGRSVRLGRPLRPLPRAGRACDVALVRQQQQRRALQLPRRQRLRAPRQRRGGVSAAPQEAAPAPTPRGSPPAAHPPPRQPRSCVAARAQPRQPDAVSHENAKPGIRTRARAPPHSICPKSSAAAPLPPGPRAPPPRLRPRCGRC